jgi:hypothetical protein
MMTPPPLIRTTPICSAIKIFSLVLLTAVLANFIASTAHAVPTIELPPWWWNTGTAGFDAEVSYFNTQGNYGEKRGVTVPLAAGNSFTSYEVTTRARYAVDQSFSLYAGLGFNEVDAVDGTVDKTNGMVNAVFAGMDYKIPIRWIRLIPEIEAGSAITTLDLNQKQASVSDGVAYGRATIYANKPVHLGRLLTDFFGYAGIYYPSQGLASLYVYGFGVGISPFRMVSFGGGLEGFETINKDTQTSVLRTHMSVAANAGSFYYDAYNPAVMRAKGFVKFSFDRWISMSAIYTKTIDGTRTADGQSIALAVNFTFPGQREKTILSSAEQMRRQQNQDLKNFDHKVEQNSGNAFEADDFVDQVAPDSASAPPASSTIETPTYEAVPRGAPPPPPLPPDGSLDDTERMLEQKRKK